MDKAFIDILQTLITEQGKEALLDPKKCKAFLADYTRGEYKKESRLLLQALDAGVQKAIDTAEDIAACRKRQVKVLQEEFFLVEEVAADVVDTLALVLRGETAGQQAVSPKHPAQPVTPQEKEAAPELVKEPFVSPKQPAQQKKKHTLRNVLIAAAGVALVATLIIYTANKEQSTPPVAAASAPSQPPADSEQPATPAATASTASQPPAEPGQPAMPATAASTPSQPAANSGQSATPAAAAPAPSQPPASSGQSAAPAPSQPPANSAQSATPATAAATQSQPPASSGQSAAPAESAPAASQPPPRNIGQLAIPEDIRNNPYLYESLRLNNLARLAYAEQDYDASIIYAEEAIRYADLSDEYVLLRLKIMEADMAIYNARQWLDYAASVDAAIKYPSEYNRAQTAYRDAQSYNLSESWDNAIAAANRVIEALSIIETN